MTSTIMKDQTITTAFQNYLQTEQPQDETIILTTALIVTARTANHHHQSTKYPTEDEELSNERVEARRQSKSNGKKFQAA